MTAGRLPRSPARYPTQSVDRQRELCTVGGGGVARNGKSLLVYLPGQEISNMANRQDQLAWEFSKRTQVLYVAYRYLRRMMLGRREGQWPESVLNANLRAVRSPVPIPFSSHSGLIRRLNGWRTARFLRRKAGGYPGVSRLIIYVAFPLFAEVVNFFPATHTHYDCHDDFETWHGIAPEFGKVLLEYERYLATRADTVTATADRLVARLRRFGANPTKVPNGVDLDLFSRAWRKNMSLPEDLASVPAPRLGFVGTTAGYVDIALLHAVAQARPRWSFVMVGPLKSIEANLGGLPNVYFVGPKPFNTLPQYLAHIDVCIVPANVRKASLSQNPGKVYQYLASGRPVVATDLPELRTFGDTVYRASRPEEFIRRCERAIAHPEEGRRARLKVADESSWEKRAETILEILGL